MTITAKSQIEELDDALGRLLPGCLTYSIVEISDDHVRRIPEALIPASAVPKRQREFAAGRVAASTALTLAGQPDAYPSVGDARQPIWPRGFTGSITHDNEIAVAVVAPQSEVRSVGLDIESVHLPDRAMRKQIMTPAEQDLWADQRNHDEDVTTMMNFSYKEAIFKCVYPLTGEFLEFTDVIVMPPHTSPIARCADSGQPASSLVERVAGEIALSGERVLSACWLD